MKVINLIRISWKALLRNKTRALLTMLGIIIGIGSVIAMVSLGQSSTKSISAEISSMGTNVIMVMRASQTQGGINIGSGSVQTLTSSDIEAIRAGSSHISKASPVVNSSQQAVYGANNWPGSIRGVNEDYLSINNFEIASGTNFTAEDVKTSEKVCLIGKTVVDNLFDDGENPLGKVIRLGKIPVKIVGVLKSKGQNQMGMDQDDIILMPYTTVQKRMLAINYIHMISASAIAEEASDLAVADIESILRRTHKIKEGADDDFEVRTQQQILDMLSSVTGMLTLLLAAIAAISLLVGGIGIMNIMYVTVTERTREIGLRMAVGARNNDILKQFLFESSIMSLAGGMIGMAFGIGLSYIASYFLGWPFVLNLITMGISFFVCAAIGIFFGWYPARKASNLDPINALRYE
ncbi:MAG: ABC transporter permease [Bacteroidales bacterium]|nr:ABC transporter permease [Bacteroidales bacterium]MDD3700362.1 ABC transporter permease [Bacteroidales bacterium]MDY0368752.1 ABC transporter permease [Bacteroidales bacterium]